MEPALTSFFIARMLVVAGIAGGIAAVTAVAPTSVPAGTGPVPGGTSLTFGLADRLEAKVNVGSGNLLVRSTDLVLPGIEGNATLGGAYNSLLVGSSIEAGALGTAGGPAPGSTCS